MRLLFGLFLVTLACAHIEPPPGGPDDRVAPVIISITPDSVLSLPGFDDEVSFNFDEVISEGGQPNFGLGSGTLEKLVLLSPSDEVPQVRWRRDRITVKPNEGWRPNTVYRVELLAGIQDLRTNTMKEGVVTTFTTGDEIPGDSLYGRVVNWSNRRPVRAGLIEAILMPDSLAYRTVTDSTGRFTLGPLAAGEYLVYGVIDQNTNLRRDGREDFDSLRVPVGRDSVGELWAFRHDSLPPRISTITSPDTITITVTFSQSIDPYQRLDPDSVRVLALPDSVPVPVVAILPKTAFDSVFQAARGSTADSTQTDSTATPTVPDSTPMAPARPDSTVRDTTASDSARADMGPLDTRPALFTQLYIRVAEGLAPGGRYYVEVRGVRSLSGVAGEAFLVVRTDSAAAQTPALAPPDTTGVDRNIVTPDTARVDTARVDTAGVGTARVDIDRRAPPTRLPPPPTPAASREQFVPKPERNDRLPPHASIG
jgi:hypothetical protein